MDEEITERIDYYLLHDPIGNVEGAIAEYATEKLVAAEQQGAVFIAVYNTGRREIVKAEDITPPQPMMNGITLVQPIYVDQRAQATVAAFDALQSMLTSSMATASEVGGASTAAKAKTAKSPVETFEEALSALRALAYPEEPEDADA